MLVNFESKIFELIDALVEHGDDDDLFASGYLQGHITLAVADAEMNGESSLNELSYRVEQSIDKAIQAGELSPTDQVLVHQLWQTLFKQIR